jgi:hypothetical protein
MLFLSEAVIAPSFYLLIFLAPIQVHHHLRILLTPQYPHHLLKAASWEVILDAFLNFTTNDVPSYHLQVKRQRNDGRNLHCLLRRIWLLRILVAVAV